MESHFSKLMHTFVIFEFSFDFNQKNNKITKNSFESLYISKMTKSHKLFIAEHRADLANWKLTSKNIRTQTTETIVTLELCFPSKKFPSDYFSKSSRIFVPKRSEFSEFQESTGPKISRKFKFFAIKIDFQIFGQSFRKLFGFNFSAIQRLNNFINEVSSLKLKRNDFRKF